MARLFITPREQQFIADLNKEYVKDVVGQYILLYPVSMINTQVDPVYDEAVRKVFDKAIKVDALIGPDKIENQYSNFGADRTTKLEVLVHPRDIIDKNLVISVGDFFVFGTSTFEITDLYEEDNIFGQTEYARTLKISAMSARVGLVDLPAFRKLLKDAKTFKESDVQKTFQQQRGLSETSVDGKTADIRQVRNRLSDEMAPIALGEGARIVSQEENEMSSTFDHSTNTLYDDI